jgi:8-oxo-dGTP pyrophosphatase MutT (NUDIX family)
MRQDGWVLGTGARPPVLSVGMIPFCVDPAAGLMLLLVRRKVTVGFMDFARGKYSVSDLHQLRVLVDAMTDDEKRAVLTESYEELWARAWGEDHVNGTYRLETESATTLLASMRRGVSVRGKIETLAGIVGGSSTSWHEPEWEFPKGRKNFQEKDIEGAYREVCEETGIEPFALQVIRNIAPLVETFIGSNLKTYKYKYFLASVTNTESDLSNYQRAEISCARWFTCEGAVEAIRPYHVEKHRLVQSVRESLESVRLFYEEA